MHNARDLPALDLLKSFEASARHLSFTRAGQELFLSQSAISRQIQQLEEQLGVPLFHRRVRSLLLTDAGQAYYREISEILQNLRDATRRLFLSQSDGVVTVTTTMTFASLWLVPRLADFQARHPEIPVHIAADNALRDLKKSGLDVSIRYCTRQMAGEGSIKLFGERVVPVCSPRLLARKALSKPEDLGNFALLHYEDPEGRGPWLSWDVWFEVMGMQPIRGKAELRFSHYDQLIAAAIDGQGVGLGRIPLVEELIRSGKLETPLKDKQYSIGAKNRAYWLVLSPLAAQRTNVQTFAKWLRERVDGEMPAADLQEGMKKERPQG
jgi:LysR family glycine cleavage system transcriptional activator